MTDRALAFAALAFALSGCPLEDEAASVPDTVDLDGDADEAADGTAPAQCAPVQALSCGQTVSGDTSDLNSGATSELNGYPVAVGNYAGAEVTYSFVAPTSGPVTFRLVDPRPTELDLDLFLLDGACEAGSATQRGFHSLEFDAVAGQEYLFVVDGFAGAEGAFEAAVECDDDVVVVPDNSFEECLFGETTNQLEAAPHLATALDGQIEDRDSAPTLMRAQMVAAMQRDGWSDATTFDEVWDYIDDDGVYGHTIIDERDGRRFTWLQWYSGDTEVGYVFRHGEADYVAAVGDGDLYDCVVD